MIANKNAELHRLTGIYKNILKNAGVTLIEGRGKVGQHCEFMILALNFNVLLSNSVFAQNVLFPFQLLRSKLVQFCTVNLFNNC